MRYGLFFFLLISLPVLNLSSAQPNRPPNIILVLADDLGIPGISCYGGEYSTPNIDRLAATGMRFERCFSAPLCAPSRALCMLGRFAFRTGVVDNGHGAAAHPDREVCIAKTLKQAGYATAFAGKWSQLTYLDTPEQGRAWGFDEFLRWDKSGGERYWKPSLNKNGQKVDVDDNSYAPDMFHDFVSDFIRRHREAPFFLYYPTTLIHGPILPTPDSSAERAQKRRSSRNDVNAHYRDNIAYLDKIVGRLVGLLDEMQLRENTMIVFTGDNGSVPVGTLHGKKIDGHKSQLNEGGSRVPLIVNWAGVTPVGRVSNDLINFSDFFSTFAEFAGAELPTGVQLDSQSFAPQIRGEKGSPRNWTYVQLGSKWYVRSDRWKMNQIGELFDMRDAPFAEHLVAVESQDAQAKAARDELAKVLKELNPSSETDSKKKKGNVRNPNKTKRKAKPTFTDKV